MKGKKLFIIVLEIIAIAAIAGAIFIIRENKKTKIENDRIATIVASYEEERKRTRENYEVYRNSLTDINTDVYAKAFDTNNDGKYNDILVLSSTNDYDTSEFGTNYIEIGNNSEYQIGENYSPIWKHLDDYDEKVYNYELVNKVVIRDEIIPPLTTFEWFSDFNELENIENIENINISKVTNMAKMFVRCENIKEIDLSNWKSSNYIECCTMFFGANNIEKLKLGNWKLRENAGEMFGGMNSLREIDLSTLDFEKTESFDSMFVGDKNLTSINFGNINTNSLNNMYAIFSDCSSLKNIDLSKFNTSNVTDMKASFNGCSALTELDLSSFDTSKVECMQYMFEECNNLTKIKVGANWTTELAENTNRSTLRHGKQNGIWNMFQNCGVDHVTQ